MEYLHIVSRNLLSDVSMMMSSRIISSFIIHTFGLAPIPKRVGLDFAVFI